MLVGGSVTFSYQFIFDFLNHHETNTDRPLFFDHMTAVTIISAVSAGVYGAMPRFWFTGGFVGAFLFAPMTWWLYKQGRFNG
jgi:hypothetical protein